MKLLLTFVLVFVISCPVIAFPTRRKVTIIHSYLPGEWYHGINNSFMATLKGLGVEVELRPYVYHSAYWEDQSPPDRLKEKARILAFIKKKPTDLILVCDDEAADFLMGDLYRMGIPILFTGINRPLNGLFWRRPNMAGVLETYPLEESILMLTKMKHSIRRMSILTSRNSTSLIVTETVKNTMKSSLIKSKYKIQLRHIYQFRYWEEWKKAVFDINRQDDALWILVPYDVLDENNREMSIAEMGQWLIRHLKVPSLGIISIHTKIGLLAAIHIGPEALGRQSALQAHRFFTGSPLSQIGIQLSKYHRFEINMNEAKKLGLKIPQEFLGIASFTESPMLKYGR